MMNREKTQLERAREGLISPELREAAKRESVDPEAARRLVAMGHAILLSGKGRCAPVLIGREMRTKVNANIGTSQLSPSLDDNLRRGAMCVSAKADALMDLSTGPAPERVKREVLKAFPLPLGTVPIYPVAVAAFEKGKDFGSAEPEEFFQAVERDAQDGVDFATLHCGVTRSCLPELRRRNRKTGVVSRGGSLMIEWMLRTGKENPLFEEFDRLIQLARQYDLVLSLGDGLRPGCTADATDGLQLHELMILGDLCSRATHAGVQVMIEGPGHVPLDQIAMNVALEKRICQGAPFYVLGPLVTDVAPGYDHITSAIGGAVAGAAGADFLCYVTPAEHLRLPTAEDVRAGVIAARIAAHAADLAKGHPQAKAWDDAFSEARMKRDWARQLELALDPEMAQSMRAGEQTSCGDGCSMCGAFCSMKRLSDLLDS